MKRKKKRRKETHEHLAVWPGGNIPLLSTQAWHAFLPSPPPYAAMAKQAPTSLPPYICSINLHTYTAFPIPMYMRYNHTEISYSEAYIVHTPAEVEIE